MSIFKQSVSLILSLCLLIGCLSPLAVSAEETLPEETVLQDPEAVAVLSDDGSESGSETGESEEEIILPDLQAQPEISGSAETSGGEPAEESVTADSADSENTAAEDSQLLSQEEAAQTQTEEEQITSSSRSSEPVFYFSNGKLTGCDPGSATEIVIPDQINSITVSVISTGAFQNLTGITSVVIPGSVKTIGEQAFAGCTSLASVTVPSSVTYISSQAFEGCTSLPGIDLPGVTSIQYAVFENCSALKSVSLPNTLTFIGNNAFSRCTGLTSVTIPGSVESVGSNAFANCTALTSVVVEEGVCLLNECCFWNCTALTDISFPSTLYSLGDYIFAADTNASVPLENVDLSHTALETLSKGAFIHCTSLQTVKLPQTLTAIESEVFRDCTALTGVNIPDAVQSIGDSAFYNCQALKEIHIPDGVTALNDWTFFQCSSLTELVIPDSVRTIGNYALRLCTGLTAVEIPDSVQTIGSAAFRDCTGLISVVIPDSVTSLGEEAFSICNALTSVEIGEGITQIQKGTFSHCSELETVTFGSNVTTIGEKAFSYCYNKLSKVTLPAGVTTIGDYAFEKCNQIQVITIPEGVTAIGSNAFDCNVIQEAWIMNRDAVFGSTVFPAAPAEFTIYGYSGSTAEAYAQANGHQFKNMESRTLSVRLFTEEETEITEEFTVSWYDSEDTLVCETPSFSGADPEETYRLTFLFDDTLAVRYLRPEDITVAPEDQEQILITLQSIPTLTFSGTVADREGSSLSAASICVSILGTEIEYTTETDSSGSFCLTVPALDAAATVRKDGYYTSRTTHLLTDIAAESYSTGTVTLMQTVADRVTLTVSLVPAAEDPDTAEALSLTDLQSLSFRVTGASGSAITGYEIQGSDLIFQPDTVSAGETITVQATDPRGEYLPSNTASVALDSSKIGSASLSLVQKGRLQLGAVTGPAATATLFNSQGQSIWITPAELGKTSAPLDAGNYTLVFLESTSILRSIDSLSYLDSLGLTEGTDYLKQQLTVQNGVLTKLSDCAVPELNESRLIHTLQHGISLSRPGGLAPGELFLLRLSYTLNPEKGVNANLLQAVLPQGIEPAENLTALVNNAPAACSYDASSRTVTVDVSGKDSCDAYVYCMAGGGAGDYSINGALSLSNGVLQPIGTTVASVQTATLTVPQSPPSASITASGKTAPHASVTVYDNGSLVASTTANAVGSWSTGLTLAGDLYSYSYHYIHAEIHSDLFDETILTEEKCVIYDERSASLAKITMYNTDDFGENATVFDFTGESSIVPRYRFNPVLPTFRFEVEFEGTAQISEASVIVKDDLGTVTLVELEDSGSGTWTATHDFERPPVEVGASFIKSHRKPAPMDDALREKMLSEVKTYSSEMYAAYDSIVSEYAEASMDPDTQIGTLSFLNPETEQKENLLQYRFEEQPLEEGTTAATLEEMGYLPIAEDESQWILPSSVGSSIIITVADLEQMCYLITTLSPESSSTVLAAGSSRSTSVSWYEVYENGKFFVSAFIDIYPQGKIINASSSIIEFFHGIHCFQKHLEGNLEVIDNYLEHLERLIELRCEDGSHVLKNGDLTYAKEQYLDLLQQAGLYHQRCAEMRDMYVHLSRMSLFGSLLGSVLPDKLGSKLTGKLPVLGQFDQTPWLKSKWSDFGFNLLTSYASGSLSENSIAAVESAVEADFSLLYDGIAALEQYVLGKRPEEGCNPRDPEPDDPPIKPVVVEWDPSGFVYEAVPSNRLEGVTARIYYQGSDGSDVLWNASDYDQINPQITDASGSYRWDVVAGNWKVKFSKDGYAPADTSQVSQAVDGWLPVPPPQLNINVGMVSTSAPTVTQALAYNDRAEVTFSQYMNIESVRKAVSLTCGGSSLSVTVSPLDAEYDEAGSNRYATRFALVPTGNGLSGSVVIGISTDAKNYAGTPLEKSYTSPALTPGERPTELNGPDSVAIGTGEEYTVALTLQPCVGGKTLQIESLSPSLVSVLTESVITDENGRAVITLLGKLAGTGMVTVTEPQSGLSKSICVITSSPADDSTVQSVVATLEDGTVVTNGMALPAGTKVILTSQSEGAVIRYTLNNTCPCKDSALTYSGPIVLTEDVSYLRAAACLEDVYSATIKISLTVTEETLTGDLNGDGSVNEEDVEYLLWHTLFPDLYPISANADFDGSGTVTDSDAVSLLWHALFPELYPL